jgi:hypothetical protein
VIWLSWRQHRLDLILGVLLSLGLAGAMTLVTNQIPGGQAAVNQICSSTTGPLCVAASLDFSQRFSGLDTYFELALLALPVLAGVFIGAPLLAREFEQGTVRLVWTQGITRFRWLGVTLALVLTIALLTSAVLAIAGTRLVWSQEGIFTSRWDSFDIQGPAYVGHVIFALALGTAAGALIRRTVPAMGATLVALVAIQLVVFNWVRPHYLPPLEVETSKPIDLTSSWDLGQHAVDLAGHPVAQQNYQQLLANMGSLTGSVSDYFRAHGIIVLQVYQPESRFWLFQEIEAVLFVVLAAILLGVTTWSIRRA